MTKRILLSALFFAIAASMFAGIAGTSPRKPVGSPVPQPSISYSAQDEVSKAMQDLDALEQYVVTEKATLEEVKASKAELLTGLDLREDASPFSTQEGALGIPSLVWGLIGGILGGCILGLVAVLIVYLVTEDKQETKMAFVGCVIGSVLAGLISLALRAAGIITF